MWGAILVHVNMINGLPNTIELRIIHREILVNHTGKNYWQGKLANT